MGASGNFSGKRSKIRRIIQASGRQQGRNGFSQLHTIGRLPPKIYAEPIFEHTNKKPARREADRRFRTGAAA
jgi:hypothetical protein